MTTNFKDFEALRPQLLALSRALTRRMRARVDPEDMVQTVLTEIYAKLQQGKEIQNPHSYANQALKNRILDEVRRFRHKLEHGWPGQGPSDDEGGQTWEPVDPRGVDPHRDPLVKQLLGRLEEHERCFLWRVIFEERSVRDARELCGWPDKSPYFHLRRLLDRLRAQVELPPDDESEGGHE